MSMPSWSDAYQGTPPWDIGRPQPAFVDLHASGALQGGALLDAGCGTGENALFFAARGFDVLGIDIVTRAIDLAREKSRDREIPAEFRVADALALSRLRRSFDVVIDSGLFHTYDDGDRPVYLSGVASVLRKDGVFAMLCFSDKEPTDWGGPRRVSRAEIETSFGPHLTIAEIRDVRFASRFHRGRGGKAFLTVARKWGRSHPRGRQSAPRARRPSALDRPRR